MGEFNDFTSWISRQAAILTFGVLGFANYIWGDNLFSCPCKDDWRRCIYTLSHTLSPALLVFVLDIHWKVVRANREINKCSQSSFIIFRRPMILAVSWVVFSIIEPRFAECFKKEDNCTSKEEERKGDTLTAIAAIILSLSILAFVAWFIWNMHHRSTFLSNRPNDDNSSNEAKALKKHLKGLSPKILSLLLNEDLMNLNLLQNLEEKDFTGLKNKLTTGQIKILQDKCYEISMTEEVIKLKKDLEKLSPKILSFVSNEDLMNLNLLKTLDPDNFRDWKDKLTMGQIQILKETLKKLNLAAEHQTEQQSERERHEEPGASPRNNDASDDFNRHQALHQSSEESKEEPDTSESVESGTSMKTPRFRSKERPKEDKKPLKLDLFV